MIIFIVFLSGQTAVVVKANNSQRVSPRFKSRQGYILTNFFHDVD
jgi:hypothetical protein